MNGDTTLRLDDRLKAEDVRLARMLHRGEGRLLALALTAAVVIHLLVLAFAVLPDMSSPVEQMGKRNLVLVRKYIPPPREFAGRQEAGPQTIRRRLPIPDPTPDEPEPIREPAPEIRPEALPADAEVLIGEPEPPPSGPLVAGTGGVTLPVLIEASKVRPVYPGSARRMRATGQVILQAIIRQDGRVANVTVLRTNRPDLGFERAAIAAVEQWRYEPARRGDIPVDVYLTIVVDFKL